MCLFFISGISDIHPSSHTSITEDYASTLIDDYHQSLQAVYGENIPDTKKGISAVGMVIINKELESDQSTLSIKARIENEGTTPPEYVTFKVVTGNDSELQKMLKSARIVYIGNQLIIDDTKSELAVNFLLSSEQSSNKTPHIESISTEMISVRRGNSVEINI